MSSSTYTGRRQRLEENHPVMAEKKLRVLHVGKYYPPHPGGMETHLQSLCGEMKQSIDVEVIVSSDGRRTSEELVDGIKVTRLGTVCNVAAAPVTPSMVRRIRQARADIVHLHLPNPTAILAYLASGHPGRLVITYHSDIVRQKLLSRFFWPVLRHALNRAEAIIASSPNYIESSTVLTEYRQRCRVIPFGIPLQQFQRPDASEIRRIRERYGWRLVLGVGRLVYYKGFEYLIRAMAGVDGHLLIVGDGPLRPDLERMARESGVEDRVTILSDVKDVSPYYHAADVFVLSSVARSEAFGIVQLEAMACGKPVINTDLDSGVPFVSPHGVTGLTVPPANPERLSEAINNLLNDPIHRVEFGKAGRRRVKKEFSVAVMAERTLQLYQEVMEARLSESARRFQPGRRMPEQESLNPAAAGSKLHTL